MSNIVDLTKEAFVPRGTLATAMKAAGRSHTHNQKQEQYAILMAQALSGQVDKDGMDVRGLITLLEGETGVGKTLGYLVPMCLHLALTKRKGLVSTYKLDLQRQIVGREFAVAAAVAKSMTGVSLTVAPRKGRRNFISVPRVHRLIEALEEAGTLKAEVREALVSLAEFPSGDLMAWRETHDMPPNVRTEDICLLPGANEVEAAAYLEHIEASREADLLVVTHALLLRSCLGWNSLLGRDEGEGHPFDVAVIDEADRIPDAANAVFSTRVSVPMVDRIVECLEIYEVPGVKKAADEWRKWMDAQFSDLSENHPNVFRREGGGGFAVLADPRISKTRIAARDIADTLASELKKAAAVARGAETDLLLRKKGKKKAGESKGLTGDDLQEIIGLADQLTDFVKSCDNLGDKLKSPVIQWSPVRTFGSFSVVPLWPGRLVANVWTQIGRMVKDPQNPGKKKFEPNEAYKPWLRSVVMTSATLDAPGENQATQFFNFREQVGIVPKWHNYNDTGSTSLSPEKFGEMRFMLADRNVPKPGGGEDEEAESNPDWLDYCAKGIMAAKEQGGRSLVLLPSFRDTSSIAKRVRDLGGELMEHQQGTRLDEYLKAFKADPNATLITPGGWEGLDLPGLLRHVIIPRVPFPMLDSARNRALLDAFALRGMEERKALNILYTHYNSDARRRLRQGIGRGIRSVKDSVTLWVLDPRFPLPRSITSNRRLRQRNLPVIMYMGLASCIPERFRTGISASYDDAEIFPFEKVEKEASVAG